VTPSFEQGAYIEDTILSILNQGYPDVEHIVIDGGSKDGTTSVLDRYRHRLSYVVSEADRGQSHAINKGMAVARGEILTWLNSDDRLAPGALAGIAMAFDRGGADMVAGVCELWRDGELVERHLTSCDGGVLPLGDLLDLDGCWNAGQFFFQPEVFFTRELWNRAGGSVDETSHYSMDYELWLRFAAAGARLKVIGRPVAQFRLHDAQKTHNPSVFQADLPKTRQRFLEKHGQHLPQPTRRPGSSRCARIVFFNDIGAQYGAGIAHARLAAAAAMAGHEVSVIAGTSAPRSSEMSIDQQQQLVGAIAERQPDVVIMGNLHAAGLPASFLGTVAARWPTAFVVHDLWIATGRCAYTHGCEQLLSGCDDSCPTPTEYPALAPALIQPAWKYKRHLLQSAEAPLLLGNSEWTSFQVQRALGAPMPQGRKVQAITLGVSDEFHPLDKSECRRKLGLPENAFLILLSAASLSEPRKGRDHLRQALSKLALSDIEIVLVGEGDDVFVPELHVHRFFYQTDPHALATIYSACDLFVGPSVEECLGQVFLEAAACGVPSVGYPVGGVPEAIVHGVTGLVASAVTPDSLAEAIKRIHDDEDFRHSLSVWAEQTMANERMMTSVYHRLHVVLQRSLNNGEELLGRKIRLRAAHDASANRLQRTESSPVPEIWQAVTGFGPWEGPYPHWNLPRCRWQQDLTASFYVASRTTGLHTLTLRFRNLAPGQQLRIACDGSDVFDGAIPLTTADVDSSLSVEVMLEAPQTLITFQATSSASSPEGRPMVLLFCGLNVVPVLKRKGLFAQIFRRRA
jgi:glycosyltransferase involved in cell wall biosynthesis